MSNNIAVNITTNSPIDAIRKDCDKCHGTKSYILPAVMDSNHYVVVEVPCEVCCDHELGFFEIVGPYYPQHLQGKLSCRIGCGFYVEKMAES